MKFKTDDIVVFTATDSKGRVHTSRRVSINAGYAEPRPIKNFRFAVVGTKAGNLCVEWYEHWSSANANSKWFEESELLRTTMTKCA